MTDKNRLKLIDPDGTEYPAIRIKICQTCKNLAKEEAETCPHCGSGKLENFILGEKKDD